MSLLLLLVCVVALVLVLVLGLGVNRYGSARWLELGPLPDIQPSEFAKLAIVVYMADWLARKGANVSKLGQGRSLSVIILGLVASLVLIEPDLGTTVIICAAAFSVFFVAGANLLHLAFGMIEAGDRVVGDPCRRLPRRTACRLPRPLGRPTSEGLADDPDAGSSRLSGWPGVGFGMNPAESLLPAERAH